MIYILPLKGRIIPSFVSPQLMDGLSFILYRPLEARIYFSRLLPLDGRIIPSFVSSPLRGED